MLYFAYGSNLDLGQMARRAPTAIPIDALVLPGWRLVFRGVADIVPDANASVQGGIWKITPEDERALDRYEGYRPGEGGMYRKEFAPVDGLPDGETTVMFYVMNSTGIYPPGAGYFAGIKQGYRDFGLPIKPLIEALEHSYQDKAPSHVERQRLRRTGRPTRAARPSEVAAEDKRPAERKADRKLVGKAARKAARKAVARMRAEDQRALDKASHDPWQDTSWARPKKRANLSDWLEAKYYGGERI